MVFGSVVDEPLDKCPAVFFVEELGAVDVPEGVESADGRHAFNDAAVAGAQIDAVHKVEDVLVFPVFVSLFHKVGDGGGAHAFQSGQSEADGTVLVNGEIDVRLVHIGWQHGDVVGGRLLYQNGNALDVVDFQR